MFSVTDFIVSQTMVGYATGTLALQVAMLLTVQQVHGWNTAHATFYGGGDASGTQGQAQIIPAATTCFFKCRLIAAVLEHRRGHILLIMQLWFRRKGESDQELLEF